MRRIKRLILVALLGLSLALGTSWAASTYLTTATELACNPGSCGGGG